MENWGLITGRTSALLLDPKKADLLAKQRVAAVQSHEVAHMWYEDFTYVLNVLCMLIVVGLGTSLRWSGGTTFT